MMHRAVAIAGLTITLGSVILQQSLTIDAFLRLGYPLANAIIFNFAYFTVLTSCFVCMCYVAALWPGASWLRWFRHEAVIGFAVPALLLVMTVAAFILRGAGLPSDVFRIAEVGMHYVAPPIFFAWWTLFVGHGALSLTVIPAWLLAPVIYLLAIFARGAIVTVYPYPFLDLDRLGVWLVGRNLVIIALVFIVFCVLTIVVDKWMGALKRAAPDSSP